MKDIQIMQNFSTAKYSNKFFKIIKNIYFPSPVPSLFIVMTSESMYFHCLVRLNNDIAKTSIFVIYLWVRGFHIKFKFAL